MKHTVLHDLGQDRAQQIAEKALASYSDRFADYNPTVDWTAPHRARISFKVKGISLDGTLAVNPNNIEMDLDVPFFLRPFKQTALSVIEGEIRSWLGRADEV